MCRSLVFNDVVGLQLEQVLFSVKYLFFRNTTNFTFYMSYNNEKLCLFFLPISSHPLPSSRLVLLLQKAFSQSLRFEEKLTIFVFCFVREIWKNSESLKFTGSIYRILKSRKTIFLMKTAMEKQFSLTDFSCCDKYH